MPKDSLQRILSLLWRAQLEVERVKVEYEYHYPGRSITPLTRRAMSRKLIVVNGHPCKIVYCSKGSITRTETLVAGCEFLLLYNQKLYALPVEKFSQGTTQVPGGRHTPPDAFLYPYSGRRGLALLRKKVKIKASQ